MSDYDKALLQEFADWRDDRAVRGPDLSHAAFLQWREDDDNRARIQEVLNLVAPHAADGSFPSDWTIKDAERFNNALMEVYRVLTRDRDYEMVSTLGGSVMIVRT